MTTIRPAPVRKSLVVKATPEKSFIAFTSGIGRWWVDPPAHDPMHDPTRETELTTWVAALEIDRLLASGRCGSRARCGWPLVRARRRRADSRGVRLGGWVERRAQRVWPGSALAAARRGRRVPEPSYSTCRLNAYATLAQMSVAAPTGGLYDARPPGAGWSSLAARRAHNPKVAGSNPAPATTKFILKN